MPVLLKNSIFDTQRSIFTPATGVTAQPTTYLSNQVGRIAQMAVTDYTFLPEGALKSEFTLNVNMAVDVQIGDLLVNIRLNDGITSWLTLSANESWKVLFIHPTPPGFLANKRCFIGRFIGGGVATT
jgi:hypothetical protein